jgi:hypothetical protein
MSRMHHLHTSKSSIRKSGASVARRPKSPLGEDATAHTRFVGVGGDRLFGVEVQVALDGKPELAAHGTELREALVAKLLGPSRGDLKKGAITYSKGRRPSIRQFIGPRGVGRERPLQWPATRLIDE